MEDLISIVVPMYFEEAVAEECYKRLTNMAVINKLRYELIFINDGSTDRTLDILEGLARKDPHVKVISFSRNFGHQIAVSAGIEKAGGDAIVIIDADLQDPPELIPEMVKLWKRGYDIVYAKRKRREGETWFKLVTAKVFYQVLQKLSSIKIPLDTGDFRLIDRKAAEAFLSMPEKNRFVRGMMSWVGFKQIPIEYEREERYAGETKYPLKKMLKLALDGIFSFSSKPLKLLEHLGLWAVVLALVSFTYAVICSVTGVESFNGGWAYVMTAIIFFGGIQLLGMGILGEYISRIYDESRGRPLFIIDREINTDEAIECSGGMSKGEDNLGEVVS